MLNSLAIFNFKVDKERNTAARFGKQGKITKDEGPVAMVIPTNEEWVIAQDAVALIK